MSQQRILSKQNNLQNLIKLALFHIQQYQILFFYSSMHHSADPSTPAPKSKNTTLPPEITKHYNQHEQSNIFLCKYCHSNFILSSAHSIQEMIWHTQSVHQKQANTSTKRYTLEQKMDNLKPPPKYLSKYEHMDIISDRWLDRLIIDGYAVSQIMQNVFQRLAANSDLFLVSCQRRALKLQNAKPHIIQYIPYLPLHFLPDQSIHHLTSRFKVSYEGAGLLLKRHNWSFQKGAKMYIGLRNLNVSVKVLRENNNDAVVVFSSPRMKYLYSLYGDCVNLEYRFVPLKRSGSGMHYNIGLFLGQDSALRIILFGVALINGYCVKNVKASVQMFLQVMNFKCPETIVTDFSKTVIQSIDQIKKQNELPFKHMINWHYCTQKLKIDLANQPDYKECIRRLTSALSAITKSQYDYILRQLKNSGRIGLQKLAEFEVNSRRCCFAGGKPKFVGFGIQQDRVISVTKAIQTSFFYMNRLGLFYTLAFRLQNRWNSIVESNLTKSSIHEHAIAEIQYLSSKISRQVFSKLHSLYVHSLTNLQILSKHQSRLMYKIRDKSKSSQIGQYYVEYDLKSDCWRCNCLLIYWSGLPCEHLIKIVRFFEGSLAYYIGQRWRTGSSWGNIPAFESDLNDNSKWIIKQQMQSDDKIKLKSTKLEYPVYKKEKSTESGETKNGKYVHMVNKTSEIERSNLQESKIGGIQRQILINSID